MSCYCCQQKMPTHGVPYCPVPGCPKTFAGRGWGGVDGHWRRHHETVVMPYSRFWDSMCYAHKKMRGEVAA